MYNESSSELYDACLVVGISLPTEPYEDYGVGNGYDTMPLLKLIVLKGVCCCVEWLHPLYCGMAELVDAPDFDSGACAWGCKSLSRSQA